MLNIFTQKHMNLKKGFNAYLKLSKIRWMFLAACVMLASAAILPKQIFGYDKPKPVKSFFASSVTPPATQTACQGETVSFGTITIKENGKGDFEKITGHTLTLSFGAGFTLIGSVTASLTNPSGSTVSAAINGNNLEISCTFSAESLNNLNDLTITGLKVQADANAYVGNKSLKATSGNDELNISTNDILATITVNETPDTPTGLTQNPSTFCTGEPVVFKVTPVAGVSYEWRVPTRVSITSDTDKYSVTVVAADNAAGDNLNISVRAITNGCASDWLTKPVTIYKTPAKPDKPASIDGIKKLLCGHRKFVLYLIDGRQQLLLRLGVSG